MNIFVDETGSLTTSVKALLPWTSSVAENGYENVNSVQFFIYVLTKQPKDHL
jgi:hypothetical protein